MQAGQAQASGDSLSLGEAPAHAAPWPTVTGVVEIDDATKQMLLKLIETGHHDDEGLEMVC